MPKDINKLRIKTGIVHKTIFLQRKKRKTRKLTKRSLNQLIMTRRRILTLILVAIVVHNLLAPRQLVAAEVFYPNIQNENPKSDSVIVENKIKEVSYKLILEYGVAFGGVRNVKGEYNEVVETEISWLGVSLTAINNIAFSNSFLIGVGGGLEYRSFMLAIPMELVGTCFLNFRNYFTRPEKKLVPMVNLSIGGRMAKNFDGFMADKPWHLSETTYYGVYGSLGAGFKVKLFTFQAGIMLWTKGANCLGVEGMAKVGLTF